MHCIDNLMALQYVLLRESMQELMIYEVQVGFVRIKNLVKLEVFRAMELSGSKKHLVL